MSHRLLSETKEQTGQKNLPRKGCFFFSGIFPTSHSSALPRTANGSTNTLLISLTELRPPGELQVLPIVVCRQTNGNHDAGSEKHNNTDLASTGNESDSRSQAATGVLESGVEIGTSYAEPTAKRVPL